MNILVKNSLSLLTVFCLLAGSFSCLACAAEPTTAEPFTCVMGSSGAAAEDDEADGVFADVLPADFLSDDGADENGTDFEPELLLDISSYQKDIDWSVVKTTIVRNFILRCGFTGYGASHSKNTDSYFEKNYSAIKEFGGNVGVYYYSCACSVEEARAEAEYVLTLLDGKQFELPVFLDVEDSHSLSESGVWPTNQQKIGIADQKNGTTVLTDIIDTFCKTLTDAGYCCGFYTAKSWAENYLDMERLSAYPFWLAHWTTPYTTYTGSFDVWQYSGKGTVAGITGNVDMNYVFRDFPTEIKAKGLNGFPCFPVKIEEKGTGDTLYIHATMPLAAESARMALRISVKLEENNLLYDYDKDGKVTAADARLILRASVGLTDDEYIL